MGNIDAKALERELHKAGCPRVAERPYYMPKPACTCRTPEDMRVGFHTHDDWFFTRLEDGSVRIAHSDSTHIMDADTWASVVATVSAAGETGETWQRARKYHAGETPVALGGAPRHEPLRALLHDEALVEAMVLAHLSEWGLGREQLSSQQRAAMRRALHALEAALVAQPADDTKEKR